MKLNVTAYIINEGTTSQYYGLMLAEEGNEQVLTYAPTWKTLNGAKRWAKKNGYEYIEK